MGRTVRYGIGCVVVSGAGFAGGAAMAAGGHLGGGPPTIAVPTYDESGALLLPERSAASTRELSSPSSST